MSSVKPSAAYYPMFLNITDRRCVVVGGGQVALRKVKMLLEFGASVAVVSPEICPELSRLAEGGRLEVIPRRYRRGDLKQTLIAVAATSDRETNLAVVEEAHREGSLVNVVDDAELSDFIVPSYLRRGDITLAISTAGRSPALARKIRTVLERQFGEEYASLAVLISDVRADVKARGINLNGDAWQEALDLDRLLEFVRNGEGERANSVLLDSLVAHQVE